MGIRVSKCLSDLKILCVNCVENTDNEVNEKNSVSFSTFILPPGIYTHRTRSGRRIKVEKENFFAYFIVRNCMYYKYTSDLPAATREIQTTG